MADIFGYKKELIKIKNSFGKIKSEMNDHLESINENTNEIVAISEYTEQLEAMILKLGERVDELELELAKIKGIKKSSMSDYENIVLTPKETEIFKVLYETNGNLMDYNKIARNLGLTEEIARKTVENLIIKGIPVIKKYFEGSIYLILDSDFRNLQAKENIIKF
ncbi:MAG: hypothetical protein ABIJ34_04950 [archaeon]